MAEKIREKWVKISEEIALLNAKKFISGIYRGDKKVYPEEQKNGTSD